MKNKLKNSPHTVVGVNLCPEIVMKPIRKRRVAGADPGGRDVVARRSTGEMNDQDIVPLRLAKSKTKVMSLSEMNCRMNPRYLAPV